MSHIPGTTAKHAIVTDACREARGDEGAVDEALSRLREESLVYMLPCWPKGKGLKLHFVLSAERPIPTQPICETERPPVEA